MPIITPDTSAQLDMSALDAGTYPGVIRSVVFETSKKGNPMLVVTVGVSHNGKERPRKAWLVINGEGAYGFDQLLRACHFDEVADKYKDATAEKPPFDTDDLLGQEVNVVIDTEMYNGAATDKIKTFLRA